MGFPDFLNSLFKALTPPSMSDEPSCAKCINCKARIKQLPSGQQIRIFTCPYVGEYDEYQSILPSVNPSDSNTLLEYTKKYLENINSVYELMGNSVEQPGGMSPMKNNEYKPITRYEELKYCTENVYNCGSFKPCLHIDNDGSSYMKDNEFLYKTSYQEFYFDNLPEEDKKLLRDL